LTAACAGEDNKQPLNAAADMACSSEAKRRIPSKTIAYVL